MEHAKNNVNGENIYWDWSPSFKNGADTAKKAVDAWKSEIQYVNRAWSCIVNGQCTHYSQMVWKKTTKVNTLFGFIGQLRYMFLYIWFCFLFVFNFLKIFFSFFLLLFLHWCYNINIPRFFIDFFFSNVVIIIDWHLYFIEHILHRAILDRLEYAQTEYMFWRCNTLLTFSFISILALVI